MPAGKWRGEGDETRRDAIKTKPRVLAHVGVFLYKQGMNSDMRNYKRILMRLTMKNGLSVDAPITKEISTAVGWAIRAVAVTVIMYGLAHLVTALIPLISALK